MEHLFCVSSNYYSCLTEEKGGSERFIDLKASKWGSQNQSQVFLFPPHHTSLISISVTKNINNLTNFSINCFPMQNLMASMKRQIGLDPAPVIQKSLHSCVQTDAPSPHDQAHFSLLAKNSPWNTWCSMWGLIQNPTGSMDKESRTSISHTESEHVHSGGRMVSRVRRYNAFYKDTCKIQTLIVHTEYNFWFNHVLKSTRS